MNSFLHLLAKDLIQKYGYHFDNLTILFPNKRAGLFLAQELAQLIDRPVWMPEILTLSEFIERQTRAEKSRRANPYHQTLQNLSRVRRDDRTLRRFLFLGQHVTGRF